MLSPHLSYTLHLTISVSLFLQLIFQWNDVYIFGMILFDACPDGINVNIVCPLAWTAQLENFEKQYPDAFKANVKMPPMGHFGDVEKEIGRACVALASPDFKYMSGETITLEGAMGQRP